MRIGKQTDVGKVRKLNEDSFYVNEDEELLYAVVADGMGGHKAGEIASSMMVDIVKNHINNRADKTLDYIEMAEIARRAFIAANNLIYTYAKYNDNIMGMGTTATLAMLYRDKLITVHVGDSRAYAVGADKIEQITRDHSYVAELVSRGLITPEQAKHHPKRNYITRAIGTEEFVKVDTNIREYSGEVIALASDGLFNYVEDESIKNIVNGNDSLQRAAEMLVDMANDKGGHDNITVVLIQKGN